MYVFAHSKQLSLHIRMPSPQLGATCCAEVAGRRRRGGRDRDQGGLRPNDRRRVNRLRRQRKQGEPSCWEEMLSSSKAVNFVWGFWSDGELCCQFLGVNMGSWSPLMNRTPCFDQASSPTACDTVSAQAAAAAPAEQGAQDKPVGDGSLLGYRVVCSWWVSQNIFKTNPLLYSLAASDTAEPLSLSPGGQTGRAQSNKQRAVGSRQTSCVESCQEKFALLFGYRSACLAGESNARCPITKFQIKKNISGHLKRRT